MAGQAWLAQTDTGTTVTIRLTGLEPDTEYVSNLYDRRCEIDNGDERFKSDPDGSDPFAQCDPSELRRQGRRQRRGHRHPRRAGRGRPPSIVVHTADAMDNRLACADFS